MRRRFGLLDRVGGGVLPGGQDRVIGSWRIRPSKLGRLNGVSLTVSAGMSVSRAVRGGCPLRLVDEAGG